MIKKTEHGIYWKSNLKDLEGVFEKFSGKKLLDLGSGTGEVVEYALSKGVHAYGVEIEKDLYDHTRCIGRVYHRDMFEMDWDDYDVLYYYLHGSNRQDEIFRKINRSFTGTVIFYTEPIVWIVERFK